jgi:hypothetical protein
MALVVAAGTGTVLLLQPMRYLPQDADIKVFDGGCCCSGNNYINISSSIIIIVFVGS